MVDQVLRPGIGGTVKPIDVYLAPPSRPATVVLPAALKYKSCTISVTSWTEGPADASTMYFSVWPEVQAMPKGIVEDCLRARNGHAGSVTMKVLLEGNWWPLNILIVSDWATNRENIEGFNYYDETNVSRESSSVPNAGEFLPGRGG